ncbi:MAG: hypothetical protein OEO79_16910 [Gemmatimonadota bacterium]|nr:hypothetical protein [Gemmatimonadota bacterium]
MVCCSEHAWPLRHPAPHPRLGLTAALKAQLSDPYPTAVPKAKLSAPYPTAAPTVKLSASHPTAAPTVKLCDPHPTAALKAKPSGSRPWPTEAFSKSLDETRDLCPDPPHV